MGRVVAAVRRGAEVLVACALLGVVLPLVLTTLLLPVAVLAFGFSAAALSGLGL